MTDAPKIIMWFRRDLRLNDNPALIEAVEKGTILPIYILDDENAQSHKMGDAARVWLHHSLSSLNTSLNGHLSVYKGDAQSILKDLCSRFDIQHVVWNRCYEPWRINRDKAIKSSLEDQNIDVQSFNASLLWEPWTIKKQDGTPYKVFTPFYRKGCLQAEPPRAPMSAPQSMNLHRDDTSLSIDDLGLLPALSWGQDMIDHWDIGEDSAQNRLSDFIDEGLNHYKGGRDLPSKPYTSRLSPYLHFGEISPHQIWYAIIQQGANQHTDTYCSELGWREFSYSLLYYNPELPTKNLQEKFDDFPWAQSDVNLSAWQRGKTGIPMVDAGMRELWQTGYMHNRVRMIVGSFLVKNLRLHWRHGEEWFWDCLVDADLANNSASWQWIAGCGADAAPYFRIFNPVTQGQKFDPDGDYIRTYIPELKDLPNKYIHCPWDTPSDVLNKANIKLGDDYPSPIVDLKQSRQDALTAFQSLKQPSTTS